MLRVLLLYLNFPLKLVEDSVSFQIIDCIRIQIICIYTFHFLCCRYSYWTNPRENITCNLEMRKLVLRCKCFFCWAPFPDRKRLKIKVSSKNMESDYWRFLICLITNEGQTRSYCYSILRFLPIRYRKFLIRCGAKCSEFRETGNFHFICDSNFKGTAAMNKQDINKITTKWKSDVLVFFTLMCIHFMKMCRKGLQMAT